MTTEPKTTAIPAKSVKQKPTPKPAAQTLKSLLPEDVFEQLEKTSLYDLYASTGDKEHAMRLAHFLAQVDHESQHFNHLEENLNYKDANRIALIFRSDLDLNKNRKIEPEELEHAKKYVKNPIALGNFVYANQNGNGEEATGDGYRFRGRGYLGLTGKANYRDFSDYIGVDVVKSPWLVATNYALESALWYFSRHFIWAKCEGCEPEHVEAVTKAVNGGLNGFEDRLALFEKYWSALSHEGWSA